MPTAYTVTISNNSPEKVNFCLYQKNSTMDTYDSLAWITTELNLETDTEISWKDDLCFLWQENDTGAYETISANPDDENTITFTKEDGAFQFTNIEAQSLDNGTLTIICDNTIPSNEASVGIGMYVENESNFVGRGTFSVPAEMNETFSFTSSSTTEYYITYGNFIQGTPMELSQSENSGTQIIFNHNITKMTVTLNVNNTWTVAPTT